MADYAPAPHPASGGASSGALGPGGTLVSAPPTSDPLTWDYQAAAGAVLAVLGGDGAATQRASNAAYLERHDHWQDGRTWTGPTGSADGRLAGAALAQVARQFTPVDVLGEIVNRAVAALARRTPVVDLVDRGAPPAGRADRLRALSAARLAARLTPRSDATGAEGAEGEGTPRPDPIAEARTAVVTAYAAWAQRAKLREKGRRTLARARWAGAGVLRVWVPPGRLVDRPATDADGETIVERVLPTNLSLADALAQIEVTAPAPGTAAVWEDERTRRPVGVFLFTGLDGKKAAELWTVDDDGLTVVRVLRQGTGAPTRGGADDDARTLRLDLGGRIPLVAMTADLLVTEPMRSVQAQVNLAASMLSRILETAGFPERYILNAAPEGVWFDTPLAGPGGTTLPPLETKATPVDGVLRTFYLYPTPRTLGASVVTEVTGVLTTSEGPNGDVRESRATPSVVFRDPTNPEYLTHVVTEGRTWLLMMAHQGHAVGGDAAQRSGIALEQARADFITDADDHADGFESLLAGVAEATLALARLMTAPAEAPDLERDRVVVTVTVDAGPRSPEAQRVDREAVQAGTLSLWSALVRDGVDDVDAEIAEIRRDPYQIARLRLTQGQAAAAWTGAGVGMEAAAMLVGLTAAEVELLRTNGGFTPGDDGLTP